MGRMETCAMSVIRNSARPIERVSSRTQVEDRDDAEMHRVDARRVQRSGDDRDHQQGRGRAVEEHARYQEQGVDHQEQDRRIPAPG